MKRIEIKEIIGQSFKDDEEGDTTWKKLEEAGVSYDFSDGFRERVLDRLFDAGIVINRKVEFIRSWNSAFIRIALTGAAAIIILMISLYLINGSFSLNSILGLNDNYDESIVCLLTGN